MTDRTDTERLDWYFGQTKLKLGIIRHGPEGEDGKITDPVWVVSEGLFQPRIGGEFVDFRDALDFAMDYRETPDYRELWRTQYDPTVRLGKPEPR